MSGNRGACHTLNDALKKLFSCEDNRHYRRFIYTPGPREAFEISILSAAITLMAFIAGMVISASSHSSATLGYALENAVDLVSSLVVVWRFWGGGNSLSENELEKREKRASIGIAFMMVVLAVCVFSVAVEHLAEFHAPKDVHQLFALSVPSFLVFTFVGGLKWHIAIKTKSPAMKKDAVCSLSGALLSLGVLVGAALFMSDDNAWWFDATVAIVISIGLALYGLRTLVKNVIEGKAYWTLRFWTTAMAYKRKSVAMEEANASLVATGAAQSKDVELSIHDDSGGDMI
jgi:hypothetical protein